MSPQIRHILSSLLIAVVVVSSTNTTAIAQSYDRSTLARFDHKFTLGFERAVYTIYSNRSTELSNKTVRAEESCNRILFRMRLTTRFRLETGLSFRAIDKLLNYKYKKSFNLNSPCKLAVPLTVQYQLVDDKKRLRPYFGAGVQYMMRDGASNTDAADMMYNNPMSNNLKYLNIIFTQGIIYDINPNLQITQSIHIVPENGIKPIGINIGVGYRIK